MIMCISLLTIIFTSNTVILQPDFEIFSSGNQSCAASQVRERRAG